MAAGLAGPSIDQVTQPLEGIQAVVGAMMNEAKDGTGTDNGNDKDANAGTTDEGGTTNEPRARQKGDTMTESASGADAQLEDIEEAQTMSSSDHDLESMFDEACRLRDAGEVDRAIDLFRRIVTSSNRPQRKVLAASHGLIGGLYLFEKGDPKRAEVHFRESSRVSPGAELASVGLFHALVAQDRLKDALMELLRFVTLKDSSEYRQVLEDFSDAGIEDGEVRSLLVEARRAIQRWSA